jgi:hypothetical protein
MAWLQRLPLPFWVWNVEFMGGETCGGKPQRVRMRLMGYRGIPVTAGTATLKDAMASQEVLGCARHDTFMLSVPLWASSLPSHGQGVSVGDRLGTVGDPFTINPQKVIAW